MSTEQNKTLTLGSLFDGSGGFPLGGLLTGQITPVWSSEIEPFAIRVTTKREALRRCVCHQRSRPASSGHHHFWESLSGYVHRR